MKGWFHTPHKEGVISHFSELQNWILTIWCSLVSYIGHNIANKTKRKLGRYLPVHKDKILSVIFFSIPQVTQFSEKSKIDYFNPTEVQ